MFARTYTYARAQTRAVRPQTRAVYTYVRTQARAYTYARMQMHAHVRRTSHLCKRTYIMYVVYVSDPPNQRLHCGRLDGFRKAFGALAGSERSSEFEQRSNPALVKLTPRMLTWSMWLRVRAVQFCPGSALPDYRKSAVQFCPGSALPDSRKDAVQLCPGSALPDGQKCFG